MKSAFYWSKKEFSISVAYRFFKASSNFGTDSVVLFSKTWLQPIWKNVNKQQIWLFKIETAPLSLWIWDK